MNIETSSLSNNSNQSRHIWFNQLQQVVRNRQRPYFFTHIHEHTKLPGPMTHGNSLADSLAGNVQVTEAMQFHSLTHTNVNVKTRFSLTNKPAHMIVKTCPTCQILNAPQKHPEGINPRGLIPNSIWQMGVIHAPAFGCLSFVHVTVDTTYGFITATAQIGKLPPMPVGT